MTRDAVVGWPADAPCGAGWLVTEYLVRQRSVGDIAAELSCEPTVLRDLLARAGVQNGDMHPAERSRRRFDRLIATVSGSPAVRIRTLTTRSDQDCGWGRECADEGCDTILHHFHEGDRCYLHERQAVAA